jgi:hypothetical protein
MFVLMTKAAREAEIEAARAAVATEYAARLRKVGRALAEKVNECHALEVELAPLKAARERANANLAAANAARRRDAIRAPRKQEPLPPIN